MTNAPAERAEDVRDLRRQITGLEREESQDMVFRDTSPRRQMVTIYSVIDGEPISINRKRLEAVMAKKLDDGRDAFVGRSQGVPTYRKGTIKCFLHPESPERPILNEIGLSGISCPAAQLANPHSKRIHAQHRHKQEWEAYMDYLNSQERDEDREQRRMQLEATLAIAERAGGPVSEAPRRGRPPKE